VCVDRTPSCAVFGTVVGMTTCPNNCVPARPCPCHTVSWLRPDTPVDQGTRHGTGLRTTGRDYLGLSDNAEVGSCSATVGLDAAGLSRGPSRVLSFLHVSTCALLLVRSYCP
jgi:hypothetical protein